MGFSRSGYGVKPPSGYGVSLWSGMIVAATVRPFREGAMYASESFQVGEAAHHS